MIFYKAVPLARLLFLRNFINPINNHILAEIMQMPPSYGIIGYPLAHTFSPAYFNNKFAKENIDAVYNAYPLASIDELPALIWANHNLRGLNVTIPYKESVLKYLQEIDDDAARVGAVNCITIQKKVLKGYNTDIIGFKQSLIPVLQPYHKHALILGTGGGARAVAFVLDRLGIPYVHVSRSKTNGMWSYDELTPEIIAQRNLIINTTPLGMYPNLETYPPIPYYALTHHHLLFDLIYNPLETKFLDLGKQNGAVTKNGYEMLHIQAEASWEIWNRANNQ